MLLCALRPFPALAARLGARSAPRHPAHMAAPPPPAAAAAALAPEDLTSPAGRLRGARLLMDAVYSAFDPKAGRAEDWVPKGCTTQSARRAGRPALSASHRRAPRRR